MNVNKGARVGGGSSIIGTGPAMLSRNYYCALIRKYSISPGHDKTARLTLSMMMGKYKHKNIYFSFPRNYDLKEITNLLYENLAQQIFANYADITGYSVGDRLKKINEKGKNTYVITAIKGGIYMLTKANDPGTKREARFDSLKRNYIEIQQNTRNSTLSKYGDYFKNDNTYGFLPTHFTKKFVLIAGQTMWNDLRNRNCIPSIYLPNTRESEQTIKRSIDALEDCITYVTPRYEVCYEEILKKGILVDTIVTCNTDLGSLPQIISDQSKYHFKLIVISNESEVQRFNDMIPWKWQKEEIELLEEKTTNNIVIECTKDKDFDTLLQHFEDCIQYVSSLEIPINLKSYSYFLHLALKTLQDEQFYYLLMRLKKDQTLERNEGGYENFADKNPKVALENIIRYLNANSLKQGYLTNRIKNISKTKLSDSVAGLKIVFNTIKNTAKTTFVIAERQDIDFLKSVSDECEIITITDFKKRLKRGETSTSTIIFYSFDGRRDFDFIYNLPNNIRLILYKQEKDMYVRQLQIHTKQLETELTNESRFAICGVKYKPIPVPEIKISPTLEQIIERLEQRSNTAYDGYKNESDSLLEDLEEKMTYQITLSNGKTETLNSDETVFDSKGNLIKSYKLTIGNKIRIYPKERLAENLLQIAIEEEPEIYGKIEEHATMWQNALKNQEQKYCDREQLYKLLKERGLKVLFKTVDNYFHGKVKFPMYDPDLKIILDLNRQSDVFRKVKKSKHLYNSTMIALNKGVKYEIQQFLKDKTVGDILQKKNFTKETLQKFIDEYMPLLAITKIKEDNDEQ
jgi:hypothetical protein